MKLIEYILNESLHAKTREAKDILMASGISEKEAHTLALKIEGDDPYKDAGKLFTPVMANWLTNKIVQSYDEHLYDIRKYKENRKKLTSAEVTTVNFKNKKKLLGSKPEDFMRHYSDLQKWNRECEAIFDDGKSDNSAKEIEVAKHNGYTMYKIDKEKHLEIPLVKNKMNWCVTTHKRDRGHYGAFSGPPYYAIMKDSDNSQFAMIIPKHFNKDPDQAVRNSENDNRLSPSDMKKVRPLIQMALNPKKHTHPYIKAIYGIKVEHPVNPKTKEALEYIKNNAIELGEWEEGEDIIATCGFESLEYAIHLGPGKRFKKGEEAIAEEPWESSLYARHLGSGKRFKKGEEAIARFGWDSLEYARHLGPGKRFEKGEDAIAKDSDYSFAYAQHLGPRKRFGKGEDAISKNAWASIQYARHLGPGERFKKGEDTIAEKAYNSLEYATHLGPGKRFEKGEGAIAKYSGSSFDYSKHLNDRFKLGEVSMYNFGYWGKYTSFLKSIGIEPPDKPWKPGDPE
jgi:hypothetical protein